MGFYCARCKRTMSLPSKWHSSRERIDLCYHCDKKVNGPKGKGTRAFGARNSVTRILHRSRESGRCK